MGLPANLASCLRRVPDGYLDSNSTLATHHECVGAKFHSPTPLVVSRTALVPETWGVDCPKEGFVWLCGTCKANLRVYQAVLHTADGELPWELRREFGNRLRALAERGWVLYAERKG